MSDEISLRDYIAGEMAGMRRLMTSEIRGVRSEVASVRALFERYHDDQATSATRLARAELGQTALFGRVETLERVDSARIKQAERASDHGWLRGSSRQAAIIGSLGGLASALLLRVADAVGRHLH